MKINLRSTLLVAVAGGFGIIAGCGGGVVEILMLVEMAGIPSSSNPAGKPWKRSVRKRTTARTPRLAARALR